MHILGSPSLPLGGFGKVTFELKEKENSDWFSERPEFCKADR